MRISAASLISFLAAICLIVTTGGFGCTSAEKRAKENSFRSIHQLVPYNVHFRRPMKLGADPTAVRGGVDYRSDPLPNARFDCEPLSVLFKEIRLDDLRACLESVKSELAVLYRLRRDPAPYLFLDDPVTAPACLRESLEKIPLPRELFFQSAEEGQISCYSTRLEVEEDELFWVKLPMNKVGVRLVFPIQPLPKTNGELELLLTSWVLTPFWKKDPPELESRILPDALCRACLGEKNVVKDSEKVPLHWP